MKLLYFTASWCQPCKKMGPMIEQFAADYAGRLQVEKVDVDDFDNLGMVEGYAVQTVPTFILVDGDRSVGRTFGMRSEDEMRTFIELNLGESVGTL